MDSALKLRLAAEKREPLSEDEISLYLQESPLLQKLTADFAEQPLFAVFRLMGLCEIPYAERLPYTQRLIRYINGHLATPEGFSCLGGEQELVPCYNAMLLEAYCRLGMAESPEAQAALRWILQYQLFERGEKTAWPHKGVCKHGGCLGKTPCYIGIGKTVRALIAYTDCTGGHDPHVKAALERGCAYMLRHRLFLRLSVPQPISPHITDIMMPQSYALSLTDLVYIAGKRKLTERPEARPFMSLLKEKEAGHNQWKIDYLYRYPGTVAFERRRKASEWISALFPLWLRQDSKEKQKVL